MNLDDLLTSVHDHIAKAVEEGDSGAEALLTQIATKLHHFAGTILRPVASIAKTVTEAAVTAETDVKSEMQKLRDTAEKYLREGEELFRG
jgi:hypothetical protein